MEKSNFVRRNGEATREMKEALRGADFHISWERTWTPTIQQRVRTSEMVLVFRSVRKRGLHGDFGFHAEDFTKHLFRFSSVNWADWLTSPAERTEA